MLPLARAVSIASTVATILLALGWMMFAAGEIGAASQGVQDDIAGRGPATSALSAPAPAQEREREQGNSRLEELVGDANDVLLAPFASLDRFGDSVWIQRSLPTLAALIVFGLGLGYVSRVLTTRA